jgi:3-phosphoshikimate 1-carboxyvinyltransferase
MNMNALITPRRFSAELIVPASKSHTIRQLLIASLASGESLLYNPLDSFDARSCIKVCRAMGAKITQETTDSRTVLHVYGLGGVSGIIAPETPLDVGNSGTTLFLALAVAALAKKALIFSGDAQTEKRSAAPLLNALSMLGVKVSSRQGCIPITVCGPVKSGRVELSCHTSQYLSALLLAVPLAPAGTVVEIDVPVLNERPYIEMTLSYLNTQNIRYETNNDLSYFKLEGGNAYKPIDGFVPGDFSSSAFPALAAAISGGSVTLHNLNPDDTQGDKVFFTILSQMGCDVIWQKNAAEWTVTVSRNRELCALEIDLNSTPDLLPACAVLAAFTHGKTRLYNVAHARIKETDRIAVMAKELGKLGVECHELPDGLVIKGGVETNPKKSGERIIFNGHGDHRVVMSLAAAGLAVSGGAEILGAEAAGVTYPDFLASIGAILT